SSLPMPSPISQLISMTGMSCMIKFFQPEFTGILQLLQMLLLKKQQFFSVLLFHEAELNLIAWLFLCKQWQVCRRHISYPWITSCCLVIRHQDDQFSIGQELYRSKTYDGRNQLT